MKKNRHARDFWKGKGFYLALALVIAGAATASFLAINSMMNHLGASSAPDLFGEEDIPWQEEQHAPVEEKQEGVPVAPQAPASSSSSSKPQSTASSASRPQAAVSASSEPPTSVEPPAVQEPSFASPKAGATLQVFSGNELVFNETLRDWRTHNGMDIEGKSGDTVKAPSNAVVASAAEDPLWGGVIVLTGNGLTMRVCGLTDLAVREGDTVAMGDVLGKVGELPVESALAAHVHLEFLQDGKYVNPADYFAPTE